jgi:hypothetical protein
LQGFSHAQVAVRESNSHPPGHLARQCLPQRTPIHTCHLPPPRCRRWSPRNPGDLWRHQSMELLASSRGSPKESTSLMSRS